MTDMSESSATSIRRSASAKPRETPEQRRRKRNRQIALGVVLLAVFIGIGFYIQSINPKGAFIWAIGLGFGYVLQRSRFCFTASLRDPVLTGSTALTKAVIIAFAISSIGYLALQMKATGMGLENIGTDALKASTALPGNIKDVGVHTVLGGFIFGIGAVIAGGCASGTLMRMGEGFVQQWIAIVFFIIGSVVGLVLMPLLKTSGFLYQKGAVYLPELFGSWAVAILVQFGLLFGLYILADWYGKKKAGEL
jgi:uncharacterized protein